MSESFESGAKSELRVTAPAGVEMVVTHGPLTEVARGHRDMVLHVAPGIYTARWHFGGMFTEKVLRLFPGTAKRVPYDEGIDLEQATFIAGDMKSLLPNLGTAAFGVFVVVTGCAGSVAQALTSEFKLRGPLDLDGPKVGQSGEPANPVVMERFGDEPTKPVVLAFPATPGRYVLRYKSVDRLSVEQTLCVTENRHTVVLMTMDRARRAERVGEKVAFRTRAGVDPASARLLSVEEDVAPEVLADRIRLATILAGKLRRNATELSDDLADAIQVTCDPLLHLQCAAIFAAVPEQFSQGADRYALSDDAATMLARFLKLCPDSMSSDIACAKWRLSIVGRSESFASYARLKSAPILERFWQWSAVWSYRDPSEPVRSADLDQASANKLTVSPFLVWRSRSKRPAAPKPGTVVGQINDSARALSDTLRSLDSRSVSGSAGDAPKSLEVSGVALAGMSATTQNLATSVLRLGNNFLGEDDALVQDLIVAMKVPANTLYDQVTAALDEVRSATALNSTSFDALFNSDPHKGNFGGSNRANGWTLFLKRWEHVSGADYLKLKLQVRAADGNTAKLQGAVTFFLHPTFNPSIEYVGVVDGIAKLTIFAVGAFTLGAQTSDGTKLELDLEFEPTLPEKFRTT